MRLLIPFLLALTACEPNWVPNDPGPGSPDMAAPTSSTDDAGGGSSCDLAKPKPPEAPCDMAKPPTPCPDLATPPDLSAPPDDDDNADCSCSKPWSHGKGTGHCKVEHRTHSNGHGNGHCKYDCE